MDNYNQSSITTIHLLGLQIPHNIRLWIFSLFLLIYCATICGNLLIITLVVYSKTLHSPMYFFLSQLSITDILLATDIVPNILCVVLKKDTIISLSKCISQFYFFGLSEASECFLLTAMSYDRYLAICRPLHYSLVMNFQFCWVMVITCWVLSVSLIMVFTVTLSQLHFCGDNVIDHFFCGLDPILQLSCSDTTSVHIGLQLLGSFFCVIPFLLIIVSYVYIIITICKIPSLSGRQKAFSTCSSHLTVVCMYHVTILCVYLIPSRGQSWNMTKFVSLLYTVFTPLMNPIVYSLRNKDLKQVIDKIINSSLGG